MTKTRPIENHTDVGYLTIKLTQALAFATKEETEQLEAAIDALCTKYQEQLGEHRPWATPDIFVG